MNTSIIAAGAEMQDGVSRGLREFSLKVLGCGQRSRARHGEFDTCRELVRYSTGNSLVRRQRVSAYTVGYPQRLDEAVPHRVNVGFATFIDRIHSAVPQPG
ncbi:hypothetical protein ACIRRA_14430 [Nocardia sp. NPDC101769]|uniref:hypothetical protein n=1 Tax=Nocardia sp. NPDC101769 TaxID=3364333 RepID=UPI003812EEAB